MGISSGALASSVIDAFGEQGIRFAVLHRASDLREGTVESDVDLVVADPPLEIVGRLQGALDRLDLKAVMVWRYDAGETLTIFLARSDLSDGLQLDLLCDRRGVGKYGVRTDALLDATEPGRWPQLLPLPEKLYLLRKRLVKKQQDRVRQLVAEIGTYPPREVELNIDRLLVAKAARSVRAALNGQMTQSGTATPWRSRILRWARRAVKPTGAWIHGEALTAETAWEISDRLKGYIPRVEVGPAKGWWWRLRHVEPRRRRPALVITFGRNAAGVPDVNLSGVNGSADVSSGLAELTRRRWFAPVPS